MDVNTRELVINLIHGCFVAQDNHSGLVNEVNVADGMFAIARGLRDVAKAIEAHTKAITTVSDE